jgi:electron transport complex protein RnfG
VRAVKVLEHAETPGLGDKMAAPGNPLLASFEGRNPAEMNLAVKKDGGDVDALTAATITSRAYVDAVARAFNSMMETTGGAQTDAATGATAAATEIKN